MKKVVKITAYIFLLILFILFSYDFYLTKKYYPAFIEDFLINPAKYSGMKSEFTGHISSISENYFYMATNKRPLKVYFSGVEQPKFGQIYIIAELNKDGTAKALEVHRMNYNYSKYFLSLVGLFILIYFMFKEWKIKRWRLVENA